MWCMQCTLYKIVDRIFIPFVWRWNISKFFIAYLIIIVFFYWKWNRQSFIGLEKQTAFWFKITWIMFPISISMIWGLERGVFCVWKRRGVCEDVFNKLFVRYLEIDFTLNFKSFGSWYFNDIIQHEMNGLGQTLFICNNMFGIAGTWGVYYACCWYCIHFVSLVSSLSFFIYCCFHSNLLSVTEMTRLQGLKFRQKKLLCSAVYISRRQQTVQRGN